MHGWLDRSGAVFQTALRKAGTPGPDAVMLIRFHKSLKIILCIAVLLFASSLLADTVILRNGARINGRIIQQNQGSVVIVTRGQRQVISKANIARIMYNNDYGDGEDRAEEQRKLEEERRRQEELRKQQERQRQEELRRQREEERKRQEEIRQQIDRQEEEKKKQEEERRKEESEELDTMDPVDVTDSRTDDSPSWWNLDRHEIYFRLEAGGARVRPLFPMIEQRFDTYLAVIASEANAYSPIQYEDGFYYGAEVEYLYERFMVRLASRSHESVYSLSILGARPAVDPLTAAPITETSVATAYYDDLKRFEHSAELGFSIYKTAWMEIRPVLGYVAQYTESEGNGTEVSFTLSSLKSFQTNDFNNRLWIRGPRFGLETLFHFSIMNQNFQWKTNLSALRLEGSAVSTSNNLVFLSTGALIGSFPFRYDPRILYEGFSLETTLYYSVAPDIRLYVSLYTQTGQANATDPNFAQNDQNLSPEAMLFAIYNANQNLSFTGIRDHHSRFAFGLEYRLSLPEIKLF